MAKLTAKQEAFSVAYVACGNASEAYRQVYDVSQTAKPETVRNNAYKVLCRPEVEARVAELRAQAARAGLVTLESHLADLARLRDLAEQDGQLSAAITAEISRGKAVGLYTDKVRQEISGPDGAPVQTDITIRLVRSVHADR